MFFDGPGGTQAPQRVIEAMSHYLAHTNANHGGLFATSRESVNKQLARWQRDGILRVVEGAITLVDREALRLILERD